MHNSHTVAQAVDAISKRDERDSTRSVAPLVVPPDAIVIDTGSLTVEQVVDLLVEHVKACGHSVAG